MFYALTTPGMPFDSSDIEQVFSKHLRPYRNTHIMVQSVWDMNVAEEMLTFDAMCEKNGIDPCDGLDRLMACPEWFAADDGSGGGSGGCGCASSPGHGYSQAGRARRVRRYMPTGPGPPMPASPKPPARQHPLGRRRDRPDTSPGPFHPLPPPRPAPPPNRRAHARGP